MEARGRAGVYAMLAVAGAALPLASFFPWLHVNGVQPRRFVDALFANPVSSFFAWDVIVSAMVLTLFIVWQGARDEVGGRWIAILATFLIGVSCGLPLFLALRERALMERS